MDLGGCDLLARVCSIGTTTRIIIMSECQFYSNQSKSFRSLGDLSIAYRAGVSILRFFTNQQSISMMPAISAMKVA